MKKILTSFAGMFLVVAVSFANIPNEKVLRTFQATFSSPREVKWFEHTDSYEVSFIQSDIRSNVKYDLDGNFMSSIRYYKEQQLPTNVLSKVKKKYPEKNIFGVTEITNTDEIYYYVKLEDEKNWLTVKVNVNGQMQVFERYKKA